MAVSSLSVEFSITAIFGVLSMLVLIRFYCGGDSSVGRSSWSASLSIGDDITLSICSAVASFLLFFFVSLCCSPVESSEAAVSC